MNLGKKKRQSTPIIGSSYVEEEFATPKDRGQDFYTSPRFYKGIKKDTSHLSNESWKKGSPCSSL